jgi:D-inositol-3-phosphate glycosyltransferase
LRDRALPIARYPYFKSSEGRTMRRHPLRIALISEHASPLAALGGTDSGGQNVYVAHIGRCLAEAGHQVDVLTRRDARRLPATVDVRPGLRVRHIDAGPPQPLPKESLLPLMSEFGDRAIRLCEGAGAYDVVHANFFMSGLVGLELKQRFGTPLVMTFHALGLVRRLHQGAADGFPEERMDIERRLVREADRIIAECPQDQHDLQALYGADPRRLSMVPCGVDLGEFSPGSKTVARRKLGLPPNDFIVLQLGRMVPRKGVDNVIRALAMMDRQRSVRLCVVGGNGVDPDDGSTPEIMRLRDIATACGIPDQVCFMGQRQRDALRAWYRAADVFVSTPWYEPFGITPLEAMACGVPVIGSDVGGIRFSVDDGVTGFLVPPHDPAALAERLERLRDHPALAEAMGRAGVLRMRSTFTWKQVADQLTAVYHALAAPPRERTPALGVRLGRFGGGVPAFGGAVAMEARGAGS